MTLSASSAQSGVALPIAYGLVRATGMQVISQTNVLSPWQRGHQYNTGDSITDGSYQQTAVVGGVSGGTLPTFNETPSEYTYSDGGVTWLNMGATNGDGTIYGMWLLGEGEWDGFVTIWNQGSVPLFVCGLSYDISYGAYEAYGYNPPLIHFHSGTDGALGSSLPSPSSNGPDQGADNWLSELPAGAAILTQCYSRMAYYMMKWLPEDIYNPGPLPQTPLIKQIGGTLEPIGDWRALRCRIFDDMGNQTGYEWTTNPAWHYVDAWIRCALMPRSEYQLNMAITSGPTYTTTPEPLPSDVTDKFDWGSIYEFAQNCDYALANGRARFSGNYAFAAQTTLAAIVEQILLCSRGYQQEYAGKLYLNMDLPRASVFLLTSEHQVPLTFTVDDKEVHQNANDYTGKFLDTLLPAIVDIVSISYVYEVEGYPNGQATIVTEEMNPAADWDAIEVGGNSNSLLNRGYQVLSITDPYTFVCQPGPDPPALTMDETGTGGVIGYPQSRFSERNPELWHLTHAVARGQIGP